MMIYHFKMTKKPTVTERMTEELLELDDRIDKLLSKIQNDPPQIVGPKIELMRLQLNYMRKYRACLVLRLDIFDKERVF